VSSPGRIFGPPREARSTFYNTVNNSMHYIQNLGPDDSTAPSTTCSITIDGSQLEGQHQQLTLRLTPKKPSSTSDHTSTIPQPARLTSTSSSHTPLHDIPTQLVSSPGRIRGPPREARFYSYNVVNNKTYYIQNHSPDDSTTPSTTCSITNEVSQLERQYQQLTK